VEARMAERDREFVEFVEGAEAALRRTAFLVSGDRHRADDIVQDALYKLYLAWPKVRRVGNPFAYARRTVVNAAYDGKRRPWRREVAIADVPDRAGDDDFAVGHADRDEVLAVSENLVEARLEVRHRRPLHQRAVSTGERKSDLRIPQRKLAHHARALRGFRRVGLQEFAPRRQVVKEIPDFDGGTFGAACFLDRRHRPAVHANLGAGDLAAKA